MITTVYAPTGYGKSTKFIAELAMKNPTARIMVVEPRVVNCLNIAKTMNKFYPNLIVGYKTGLAHKAERFTSLGVGSINYITPDIANAIFSYDHTSFDILVIDECHDMTIASDKLFLSAIKYNMPIYLVSATLPTWVKEYADSHIDLATMWEPLNKGFKINKVKIAEDILPSDFHFYPQDGNTIVFIPSKKWLEGRYSYGIAKNSGFIKSFNKVHYLFGGSNETSKALEAMSNGKFPSEGQLIFTNNAMSTGVTVPNVTTIVDYSLAIKPDKKLCNDLSTVADWIPTLTNVLDMEQRAGRGGRVCNTDYYYASDPTEYKDKRDIEDFINLAITLKPKEYKKLKSFYIKTKMLSSIAIETYEKAVCFRRKGVKTDIWSDSCVNQLEKKAWDKAISVANSINGDIARRHFSSSAKVWHKIKTGWRPDSWDCSNSSSDNFSELRIKSLKEFCNKNSLQFNNIHI